MQVEIISIGDELLIGQTINTNASWMGQELSRRGAFVSRVVTISDKTDAIRSAIDEGLNNADVVLVTGGLGPTKDDVTKKVITDYFEDELYIHEETLERVKGFFARINRPMLEVNVQQAAVPKKCTVLKNMQGTAPGMWLEKNSKILISLPGVPYEMKGIMEQEVFPRLEHLFGLKQFYAKTANLQGVGESYIADKMAVWEDNLRSNGLELAYLPSPGLVRLRITSLNGQSDEVLIDACFRELEEAYPENLYGYGDAPLAEITGNLLKQYGATVATAESCTGGALAASLVSVPGSSAYFHGGFLTYTNELKHTILGVQQEHFTTVGAVSEEVVREMAAGGKNKLNVDYCVSISGIAGPDGGTEEKPVGTVWIGIASPKRVVAKRFLFSDNRERVINRTVLSALNFLRNEILWNHQ
ncbi:MAG: competence/damage-inducible protein A [Crocinitomicaceae bacterium]|nr:competence/damage-inducible protein A [Crocinitomicaceae bacterium]